MLPAAAVDAAVVETVVDEVAAAVMDGKVFVASLSSVLSNNVQWYYFLDCPNDVVDMDNTVEVAAAAVAVEDDDDDDDADAGVAAAAPPKPRHRRHHQRGSCSSWWWWC